MAFLQKDIGRPLSEETARQSVEAVDAAIAQGGVWPVPRGQRAHSAVAMAASGLGVTPQTLARRLARAFELYGLRPKSAINAPPAAPPKPKEKPDLVSDRRLRDENARLRKEREELARRAARAEDLRAGVFSIARPPIEPVAFPAIGAIGAHRRETVILFLSDLHWGEVVDLAAMDGLNSYDLAIARARLQRWARGAADLMTRHWAGDPPERIIVILGGDLISGEIHLELAKTNEAKALPAVRDLVGHLAGALRAIAAAVPDAPIDVMSLPGNHGRSSLKPESKQAAQTSYDTLVADFLESLFRDDPRFTFFAPASGDAKFSVYGWQILATHGDRIGSRGGQGFIGPAATAARGFKRIKHEAMTAGLMLDLILIGHFHTPLQLEEGFVNGSLIGHNEYARDGRFSPHAAQQLFLAIHPGRGVSQARWIKVGAPEEGALYQPPPDAPDAKRRYRVQAISVRV